MKEKKVIVAVYLNEDLATKIREVALKKAISVSRFIDHILTEEMENYDERRYEKYKKETVHDLSVN